jgi:DNA replication protein DnaC
MERIHNILSVQRLHGASRLEVQSEPPKPRPTAEQLLTEWKRHKAQPQAATRHQPDEVQSIEVGAFLDDAVPIAPPAVKASPIKILEHRAGRQSNLAHAPLYPSAPPESKPDCPLCKDRGYLRADVPFGHPDFGKPVECQCKRAKKNDERRARLREQSKIDVLEAFREETFETFQLWLPGVQEAYQTSLQFATIPRGWLVLEGLNGCGKTHLAVAIAKRCLEEGWVTLFAVVPDLLDYLRATFSPQATECYDEAFIKMREAEVLILDDLGAEASTSWAREKLFQLLNYRYNARLATVITTNKIGFAGLEMRIRSRLTDHRLVRIVTMVGAADFRPSGA